MPVLATALRRLAKTFQTPRHFFSIFPAVESRDAKIAFALRAETAAWCDDHIQIVQHTIEHFPTRQAIRRFYPKVRRVHSAKYLHASLSRSFTQDFRVAHIVINERIDLLAALRGIKCLRAALHGITHAVCLCAPAPMPKLIKRQSLAVLRPGEKRLWHNRKAAAHSSETAVLRKTA